MRPAVRMNRLDGVLSYAGRRSRGVDRRGSARARLDEPPGTQFRGGILSRPENTERYRRRLVRQLERLGHQVTLEPLPEAA
jgi:hypothetical protein